MRSTVALALGLLAFAASTSIARAQTASAAPPASETRGAHTAPVVRVEPHSFDFGRALPGRTLRKEFVLRNAGDAELVIEGVSTSCGCTAAIAGRTRLEPGRSTPLAVTLETRESRGRLERSVLVRTNDPRTPLLQVKVLATVEGPTK